MSSPFAFYSSVTNKIDKVARQYAVNQCEAEGSFDNYDHHYFMSAKLELPAVRRKLRLMDMIHDEIGEQFDEVLDKITGNERDPTGYSITISPKDDKCNITEFRSKIEELVKRKCFVKYAYSFEQRGLCDEDVGKGFHCHIYAHMKQRAKGQVLRDITSSFKTWIEKGMIEDQCINVKLCKPQSPAECAQKYIVLYESKDGHKQALKEFDTKWRTREGLKDFYDEGLLNHSLSNKPGDSE